LWSDHNKTSDGAIKIEAEYLAVVAIRAWSDSVIAALPVDNKEQ
jgi:hypothetical protein